VFISADQWLLRLWNLGEIGLRFDKATTTKLIVGDSFADPALSNSRFAAITLIVGSPS
jgi:hypothetical protein